MEEKVPLTNVNTESFTTDYYASLLVGLIHKLNNVITVLTGHFGLMLLDPDLKPDISQPLQQMYRAALLVSQCLNEAASMGRATPLAFESVGLSELFQAVNSPAGLAVVKEYDDGIKIRVDRRKAKEIFEQLLRNASEADAKTVVVIAEANPQMVDMKFRDDGHGIKTEVMKRAFDPFFTTRKQREQFGLGLFKARGDLARMKGRIYAESDGKKYTEVIVQLPAG
ncbi:MAG TPA: HAMP domain-containing sensor histidine kinase [Chthoniobacterales bacterium]|nr:HAMP domain-containing sensor histidine kinase [Chthoniobacterales bacterium]